MYNFDLRGAFYLAFAVVISVGFGLGLLAGWVL